MSLNKIYGFSIRKARKEDMPAVLELIKELAEFEKEPEAVVTTVETLEKEGFGENPLFEVFVAEVDGKIEGWPWSTTVSLPGKAARSSGRPYCKRRKAWYRPGKSII